MMRVLLVAEAFDMQKGGGAEISCFEIADALSRRGIEVVVLARKGCPLQAASFPVEILPQPLPFPTRWITRRTCEYLIFAGWVRIYSRRFNPDVLHALAPFPGADVYQPRSGLIDETRERDRFKYWPSSRYRRRAKFNLKQLLLRWFERRLARKTGCLFLPHSKYVYEQCRTHLGLHPARMRLVHSGIDTRPFVEPLGRACMDQARQRYGLNGAFSGLFVANSNLALKGIKLIEHLLRIVSSTGGPLMDRLRIIVCSKAVYRPPADIADKFALTGPIQDRRGMAVLYRLADFAIHPAWYDPCSRAVLEAVAAGCPAVTSTFNGAADLLRRHGCGIVVEDLLQPELLIGAISELLNPATRMRMSLNCKTALHEISIETHVDQLLRLYQDIVSARC